MSDPFDYPFAGSDENSHYMSSISAKALQKEFCCSEKNPHDTSYDESQLIKKIKQEILSERELYKKQAENLRINNEKHGWIQTFSGKKFYPVAPRKEDICIRDIAHSLANSGRFTGHSNRFYSIAQHSVLVSYLVDKQFAKPALLHDASEAYIVDVPKPLKRLPVFAGYREIEHELQNMIFDKFGWFAGELPEIKEVDVKMLATEARDLMSPLHSEWVQPAQPYPFTIIPLRPEEAEVLFLERFKELILLEDNGQERYNLFIGE